MVPENPQLKLSAIECCLNCNPANLQIGNHLPYKIVQFSVKGKRFPGEMALDNVLS